MRCEWVSIIASGLCISLVPACCPLLREAPPSDPSALPPAQRAEPADSSRTAATPQVLDRAGLTDSAVRPAASTDSLIEPVHNPGTVTNPDIIEEPRSTAESPAGGKGTSPPEQGIDTAAPDKGKTEPTEEPPVLQALRCFLDKRPYEAVALLGRYEKSSQDLLLWLLPFTVRLTEGGLEQFDAREATTAVEQMDHAGDRVSAFLRPRANLAIKKMCFCSLVKEYGKYLPLPDGKAFVPGERAEIYVELDNLWDQRQSNVYSIHLLSTISIRDFKRHVCWVHTFPDDGPDSSQSQRHDFYMRYRFVVPPDLLPGFYTLCLKIIDEPTHREVSRTLDFRVTKGQW